MGKLFYTLLCLFVGITASASQITEQQALQIAAKYADIDIKSHPQRMKAAGMQQKAAAYYAFNIGDNEGFVIVSGDDSLTELVGYSDSGSFDPDKIPDAAGIFRLCGIRAGGREQGKAPTARQCDDNCRASFSHNEMESI